MAKGKIEQEIALKVTGAKEAKAAEALVTGLDGKDAKVAIDVDVSDVEKNVKRLDAALDKLSDDDKKIVLKAQIDQAERDIKKLTGQLGRAKEGAVIEVKVEQLAATRTQLEEMEDRLKRLDAMTVTPEIDTRAVGDLRTGLDDVGRSARSSRSVLANMVGNSVQDMGALAGVAGSAGVAIGQMGEYMADAAGEGDKLGAILLNFGKVAGPLAAIALATQLISDAIAKQAKSTALAAENQDRYTESLKEGGDVADNYIDRLAEIGEVTVATGKAAGPAWANIIPGAGQLSAGLAGMGAFGDQTKDILDTLTEAGIKADEWSSIVTSKSPAKAMDVLREKLARTNLTLDEQSDLLIAARSEQDNYAEGQMTLAMQQAFFGDKLDDTTDKLEAQKKVYGESATAIEDWADRTSQALQDANDWAIALAGAQQAVDDLGSGFETMTTKGSAIKSIFDIKNAPLVALGKVQDLEQGIRDFVAYIKDPDGLKGAIPDIFDPDDVNADDFLNKVAGLRAPIQQAITDAFAAAGPEAAKTTAQGYVDSIVDALDGKLSKEQVENLLGIADLTATIEVAVDESSRAKAQKSLELLTGLSGETPWTASIALALDAGTITPEAAQLLIDQQLLGAGVVLPSSLIPPPTAETIAEAQRFADKNPLKIPAEIVPLRPLKGPFDAGSPSVPYPGGIAGERGPEIINGRYLTTGPTLVPPGTRVTSRRRTTQILKSGRHFRTYDTGGTVAAAGGTTNTVNLVVQAAVIGDPFAVMNAIDDGMRRAARLLPVNQ